VRVSIPEDLEFCELMCESALGRSIDDDEHFSLILTHGYVFAMCTLDVDVVERVFHMREYMSFWIFR
jgi:hypothetical protein